KRRKTPAALPIGPLKIVFDSADNAYAQARWADAPHRLFGWWYRVGVTNSGPRSLDGVRLLLKDVPEQRYKPIYLRIDGDVEPFTRSLEGVRVDPSGTVLFDLCFRNHEQNEQIQFHYASNHDSNMRPPATYTLVLEPQASAGLPV